MAKVIEVIETYVKKGSGTTKDPYRQVYQLWTKKGLLLFELDNVTEPQ
jgi:hypothetical protein